MSKTKNIFFEKINNSDLIKKIKNSKNFEDLIRNCKEINPNITQEEVEREIKRLFKISGEKLEMVSGGKMNFNKIKTLALSALLPAAIISVGGVAQAMDNPSSASKKLDDSSDIFDVLEKEEIEKDRREKLALGIVMEPRYFVEDYNQEYTLNDPKRIFKGTFDASKYFSDGIVSHGPWRVIAFQKAAKDSRFEDFIDGLRKKYKEERLFDTIFFSDVVRQKTDNESFEVLVEECRQAWNKEHNYKREIKSYEDAFKKALLVLTQIRIGKDPFDKRRVEVLYDANRRIYLVLRTFDTRPFMRPTGGGFHSMLLHENGEILVINGW